MAWESLSSCSVVVLLEESVAYLSKFHKREYTGWGQNAQLLTSLTLLLLITILAETRPSLGKVLQAKTSRSTSALLALFITNWVSLVSEVSGFMFPTKRTLFFAVGFRLVSTCQLSRSTTSSVISLNFGSLLVGLDRLQLGSWARARDWAKVFVQLTLLRAFASAPASP